ncbi:phosphotransferase [Ornithinimicrobium pekingense]|uniref:Aminoglycoside phosphotransferase domain-containing protein n=1 Tax=Ornithinimicrobium pekingense TaxID=384677 RepID=A0ABQ2FB67_9MICO|nr:phosphotransferase [Ornithinimicrobium pekingense]GGK78861.1 hypothetical protein GCM10011509_29270 [Ornithinimicrobium pekingense]
MSLSDPGLALVLDPERLSACVGREVSATHLRPKPGVSTAASLLDADGMPWGWVRTLTGEAVSKAAKARHRAEEVGLAAELGEAELGGRDTLVQWGPLATDPRLATSMARLDLSQLEVLRHNPLRRLVGRLEGAGLVVRVTAHPHRDRLTSVVTALAEHDVPVVAPARRVPEELHRGRGVTWWPWVEGRDGSTLDGGPGADEVLHAVGQVVGALHLVDPSEVPHLRTRGWADVRAAATASVELLEAVAPGAAAGARRVLEQLPEHAPPGRASAGRAPLVVCHGDLSLDQVLLPTGGAPVLTDLDRAVAAPAVLDHATFAAVDLIEGRESLGAAGDGYAVATGSRPAAPGPWVAAVLLARVAEPWRRQVPGWTGETVRRALLAGRVLAMEDVWALPVRELAVAP